MIQKATTIVSALADKFNMTLDDVQRVNTAYAALDIEKLKTAARERVRVVPWSKGQQAPTGKLWEEIHPELLKGVKAYSVFIDDSLVYFQYEAPYSGGQMLTDDDLNKAINNHIANIVDDIVNAELPDLILERL